MTDFFQNGIFTTLHDFKTKKLETIEAELKLFSGYRPIELILPSLYSELEGPALKNIVKEISEVDYINHVIIGLDKANLKQNKHAYLFFKELKKPFSILWNDGPRLKAIYRELKSKGLSPSERGKGSNVWNCIGFVHARGMAEAIAIHDCDILTYDRNLLARLIYPVANPNFQFEFCKGFYPRIASNKMNGRVSRLLIKPLLMALEDIFGPNEYLNFMKSFRYPLAGEFSFRKNLIPELRIPSDWGLEVGILSEMQRNYATNRICEVCISDNYDHKHQILSIKDSSKGLSKMSIDIIKTLVRKLATQGYSFSKETFRSIKATYYRSALDLIDIYRSDAQMNGLKFDSHNEEKTVELFALNIMKAGESFFENPMDTPFIPTWHRVKSAIPDFLDRFKESVKADNKEFK